MSYENQNYVNTNTTDWSSFQQKEEGALRQVVTGTGGANRQTRLEGKAI